MDDDLPLPDGGDGHPREPRERAAPHGWPAVVPRPQEQRREAHHAGGGGDAEPELPRHRVLDVDDDRGAQDGAGVCDRTVKLKL